MADDLPIAHPQLGAPAPHPSPAEGTAVSPGTPQSDPEKTENRSENGQKRSDSTPQNSQPSTPNSQPLWSRLPNEPAADYQLFAVWLQLPHPRRSAAAAAALGCSIHRLRRLSARHRWKTRAMAFDNHRANAASLALDQLLEEQLHDQKERAERFRLQEWLLYEEMLQAAFVAVREFRKHPARATLNDIVKLYDLASTLGRRACGMPLHLATAPRPDRPSASLDFEAPLENVCGLLLPGASARAPEEIPEAHAPNRADT